MKTDLMPYDEILDLWYKTNNQFFFVIKGFLICIMLFLVSVVLSSFGYSTFPNTTNGYMILGSWLIASVWIYSLCKYVKISKIESKRYHEIENAITPELEQIARTWYGKDWHKALKECIEAHIPGDCPLCGAQ